MGIVKTKDLTFEYIRRDEEGNVEGITTAVDHVNIDLQAGQFIAVLGRRYPRNNRHHRKFRHRTKLPEAGSGRHRALGY